MVGIASAINRPPFRGFWNCGRGISFGINVQQLDSAVESSHREISEPSLDALGCLVIHFAGKDECPSGAFLSAARARRSSLKLPRSLMSGKAAEGQPHSKTLTRQSMFMVP